MAIIGLVLVGLVMGLLFGLALEKSRVFEPGIIVGQMQLKNFTMLKVFLTSVAAGLVFLAILHGTGAIELGPKATQLVSNIAGGLILGSGLVLAGACPGTSLAQIGAGYKDAWYILAGSLLGALFYGYIKAPVIDPLLAIGDFGKVRLDQILSVPFWILALIFGATIVAVLYWLEQRYPWNAQLGEDYEGLSPEARRAA